MMCFATFPVGSACSANFFVVSKPGARFLFIDALIIGGVVTHQEMATRSSIGYYLFRPPGENDRLLQLAGFRVLEVTDTTENAARISGRWRDARQKHLTGISLERAHTDQRATPAALAVLGGKAG
jgi:hypothetical protein